MEGRDFGPSPRRFPTPAPALFSFGRSRRSGGTSQRRGARADTGSTTGGETVKRSEYRRLEDAEVEKALRAEAEEAELDELRRAPVEFARVEVAPVDPES